MDHSPKPSSASLFQVYLRLRPAPSPLVQLTSQSLYPLLPPPERYLTVEPASEQSGDAIPTHITLNPPNDSRKRAVEKFAFTKVFEEQAEQIDIFRGTGAISLVEGVLGEGRDGLLATLGVTGSGKSHTILGSKSQRGLIQLSLDVLYRSLSTQGLHPAQHPSLIGSLAAADASEAQILSASTFLDSIYGDGLQETNRSRAPTPMLVGNSFLSAPRLVGPKSQWSVLSLDGNSILEKPEHPSIRIVEAAVPKAEPFTIRNKILPSQLPFWNPPFPRISRKQAKIRFGHDLQDPTFTHNAPKRKFPQRPSALPQFPDVSNFSVPIESNAEFAIVISMYEVYNDRIFDLLAVPSNQKDLRRRHLLFKSTEASPDRKMVAGLRKVVCGSYDEAMMVLETGLIERRVAGTGSNSVSSRSHGFFCVEVKKRRRGGMPNSWNSAQLTIVDLAGSERARNAKTAGATLAEAGKINESLMYLGQCLQMQSDNHDNTKPSLVPFRQCKLTELLFSNSFPSSSAHHVSHPTHQYRNPQKGIMIVTADPLGDFNATSQILRYSALAREVTVPRIPSVASTIGTRLPSGRTSPNVAHTDEAVVEMAFSEIVRLNEEVEMLNMRISVAEERKKEAEEHLQRVEEQAEEAEVQVREECWKEMERWTEEARRRWMGAWGEEADRNGEHLDRKLEILSQGIRSKYYLLTDETNTKMQAVYEDPVDYSARTHELENENENLRQQIKSLKRELNCRSPTKSPEKRKSNVSSLNFTDVRLAAGGADCNDSLGNAMSKLNKMALNDPAEGKYAQNAVGKTPNKTPGKKMKKLTARKWDLMDENEMDAFENHRRGLDTIGSIKDF